MTRREKSQTGAAKWGWEWGRSSTTLKVKGGRSWLIVLLAVIAVTASVLLGWWRSPAASDVGRAGEHIRSA